MFAILAAAVFAGEVTAPLLALLIVLAPLLALVAGGRGGHGPGANVVTTGAGLLTVGMVLSANVMVVARVAALSGISLGQSLAVMAVTACLIVVWRRVSVVWVLALVLGLAGLTVILGAMAAVLAATPWSAWTQLASRPMLAFSPQAAWVTEGRTVRYGTTLIFNETHHVTAPTGGVFRVEAGEPPDGSVWERRLNPGDALALRAGDRLTIAADTRVRFESGKRIPGAPLSGVAWADPPRRSSWATLVEALGLVVTMLGGALALLGGRRPDASRLPAAVAAPLLLIVLALTASCWGVYAAWFAADLGLGASTLGPLVEAVHLALGDGGAAHLSLLGIFGLAMLFLAGAAGLANRVGAFAEAWSGDEARPVARVLPDSLWLGMLAVGVMLSQYELESGTVLRLGWGLGASAWAAPLLGGDRGAAVAGSLTGTAVFAALSIAHALALPGAVLLGPYPALVAAPAAVVVAVLGRRRRPSSRALRVRPAVASVAGNRRA